MRPKQAPNPAQKRKQAQQLGSKPIKKPRSSKTANKMAAQQLNVAELRALLQAALEQEGEHVDSSGYAYVAVEEKEGSEGVFESQDPLDVPSPSPSAEPEQAEEHKYSVIVVSQDSVIVADGTAQAELPSAVLADLPNTAAPAPAGLETSQDTVVAADSITPADPPSAATAELPGAVAAAPVGLKTSQGSIVTSDSIKPADLSGAAPTDTSGTTSQHFIVVMNGTASAESSGLKAPSDTIVVVDGTVPADQPGTAPAELQGLKVSSTEMIQNVSASCSHGAQQQVIGDLHQINSQDILDQNDVQEVILYEGYVNQGPIEKENTEAHPKPDGQQQVAVDWKSKYQALMVSYETQSIQLKKLKKKYNQLEMEKLASDDCALTIAKEMQDIKDKQKIPQAKFTEEDDIDITVQEMDEMNLRADTDSMFVGLLVTHLVGADKLTKMSVTGQACHRFASKTKPDGSPLYPALEKLDSRILEFICDKVAERVAQRVGPSKIKTIRHMSESVVVKKYIAQKINNLKKVATVRNARTAASPANNDNQDG